MLNNSAMTLRGTALPDIFTNLDAQYLYELGHTFIADNDLEVGLRLVEIAKHLQSLDEKSRIDNVDDYKRGVHDGLSKAYERSNLPPPERTPTVAMVKAGVGITVIPPGVTAAQAKAEAKATEQAKKKFAGVHLKLNLEQLRRKE